MSLLDLKTVPTLIVALTAALVTQSVFGVPDHQLVFTENSSLSLSVTYDGTPVSVTSPGAIPDFWLVSVPVNLGPSGFGLSWFEPGSNVLFNTVAENVATGVFGVTSDGNVFPASNPQPDGFTFLNAGTDNSDGVGVDITFHDLGDTGVPEPSTWRLLTAGALLWLIWRRRWSFPRIRLSP